MYKATTTKKQYKMLLYHVAIITKSHIKKGLKYEVRFFLLWMEQPNQPELRLQVCMQLAP